MLTIPCPSCEGSGRKELTGVYADTLKFLREQTEQLNGAQLARKIGVTTETMCNRLSWLEDQGFAVSEKDMAVKKGGGL